MIHDSKSRSKRYCRDLNKPHIVLSRLSGMFAVYADPWKANGIYAASDFKDKLNAERAKS